MWVGTFFGGINRFNPSRVIYSLYPISDIEGEGLSSSVIGHICKEPDGTLWVATEGKGLNRIDPVTGRYEWYFKGGRNSLSDNNVKDFIVDNGYGVLWVGTHLGGLDRIDLRTGRSTPFALGDDPLTKDILCLTDMGDSLLAGSTEALLKISKKNAGRKILLHESVPCTLADADGNAWFCADGLYRLKRGSSAPEKMLDGISAVSLSMDQYGRLWLCSFRRGLHIYTPETGKLEFCDLSDTWPEGEVPVSAKLSPATGHMIVSSTYGLTIMDTETFKAKYLSAKTGYPLATSNRNALKVGRDGTIYSGGMDGMVSFNEKDVTAAATYAKPIFTKLYTDGQEQVPGGGILDVSLPYCTSLTLPPSVTSFSLEYSSPGSIPAQENEYCLGEGGESWSRCRGAGAVSFSDMHPGKYLLRMRPAGCTDSETERRIVIRILPPWYRSAAAMAAYILLAVTAIAFMLRKLVERIRAKEEERVRAMLGSDKEKLQIIEKATAIVYHNLDNPGFEVSAFASGMTLSRTALFEKLKAATGKTPNEFLTEIRLKEAADMLKNRPDLNVGDISDRVGFSSPRYFSKCFKERYSDTPLAYRRKS